MGLDGERRDEAAQLRAEGEGIVGARGGRAGGSWDSAGQQILRAPGTLEKRGRRRGAARRDARGRGCHRRGGAGRGGGRTG